MKKKIAIIDVLGVASTLCECEIQEAMSKLTELGKEPSIDVIHSKLKKNSEGLFIGGVQEFYKVILEVLDKINPTHMALIWGTPKKTNIRREIYEDYKNNESKLNIATKEQLNTIKYSLLPVVKQFSSNKYEAIDLAATLAEKFKDTAEIHIIARNNNYLQLTDIANVYIKTSKADELNERYGIENCHIINGFFRYNREFLKYIKDLEPEQIIGVNALVGSPTAGIPGVKGIGIGTAVPLIKRFHTIKNLYKEIENLDTKELASIFKTIGARNPLNKLIEGKDNAFISEKLYHIYKNVFIDEKELKESTTEEITFANIGKILNSIGLLNKSIVENHILANKDVSFRNLLENNNFTTISYERCESMISHLDETSTNSNIRVIDVAAMKNSDMYEDDMENYNEDTFSYKQSPGIPYEEHEQCQEGYGDLYYNDNSEVFCNFDDEVDYDNEDEQVNSSSNQTLSIIETLIINKYQCCNCQNIAVMIGSDAPKFCPNCGIKNNVITNNIDILEETGFREEDLKVNRRLIKKIKAN